MTATENSLLPFIQNQLRIKTTKQENYMNQNGLVAKASAIRAISKTQVLRTIRLFSNLLQVQLQLDDGPIALNTAINQTMILKYLIDQMLCADHIHKNKLILKFQSRQLSSVTRSGLQLPYLLDLLQHNVQDLVIMIIKWPIEEVTIPSKPPAITCNQIKCQPHIRKERIASKKIFNQTES